MPDHEAPIQAFYDHETDEPRATGRRRRQVADWGVGEDVFDRLPSRRFARAERRGDDARERGRQPASAARDDLAGHREAAPRRPRRRPAVDWLAEVSPRPAEETGAVAIGGDANAPAADEPRRTIVIGSAVEDTIAPAAEEPRRTIVIGGAVDDAIVPAVEEPRPRRTVVIGGHPDKLPAPRRRRPPKTALERIGASPDRLAAYAVGLGLLLILIAVLTTGH